VDGYQPSVTGNITDLNVLAEEILKSLPGVVSVERMSSGENPTKRIIHIRDWHFVTRDDYAKDLRDTADNPLSDAEIDAQYEQLLLEVCKATHSSSHPMTTRITSCTQESDLLTSRWRCWRVFS
jgi:hypothetical protein